VTGFEVEETWEVLNVVVTAGLFKQATVKLPLASATWAEDHVAFSEVTSAQAFRRELPPVAAPARPITSETPVSLPGARVAGAIVEYSTRKAIEMLFTRPGGRFRLGVRQLTLQGGDIRFTAQTETLLPYYGDAELGRIAREALARAPRLTDEERLSLAVAVAGDAVELTGNVFTAPSRDAAVQAVAQALAPATVSVAVYDDLGLETALGHALFVTGVVRAAPVHPRARLGHVTLYGRAKSPGAAAEAERVAAALPGVVSVQSRLEIGG
jgi:osmotically-inducible protein OsmY